jgi:hypothetical protein
MATLIGVLGRHDRYPWVDVDGQLYDKCVGAGTTATPTLTGVDSNVTAKSRLTNGRGEAYLRAAVRWG